ncbi:MAG TPA: hypothetical protein ACN46V_05615, partial [Prochlorococcus sp.]
MSASPSARWIKRLFRHHPSDSLLSHHNTMVAATASLDTLCINSIRMLAVDAINKSNSGHPGLPM